MTLPEGFDYNCATCKRARLTGFPTCDAFLDGIPYQVYSVNAAHLFPVEGDNGIRYEPNNFMRLILTGVYRQEPLQYLGESQLSAERREAKEKGGKK